MKDSNELISALNNHIEKGNWRIYPFLIEFHCIRRLLCSVSWKWFSHEANRASEAAAKLAILRLRNETWATDPQPLVAVLSRYGLLSLIDLFRSSIWFPLEYVSMHLLFIVLALLAFHESIFDQKQFMHYNKQWALKQNSPET